MNIKQARKLRKIYLTPPDCKMSVAVNICDNVYLNAIHVLCKVVYFYLDFLLFRDGKSIQSELSHIFVIVWTDLLSFILSNSFYLTEKSVYQNNFTFKSEWFLDLEYSQNKRMIVAQNLIVRLVCISYIWWKCKRKLFLDSFHLFCVMEAFMMLKRIQKMPEIEYWLLGIKENKRWAKQLHGPCVSRCESVYYLDKFLYVAKGVATINMFAP